MLRWNDVLQRAQHGNPTPATRVEKSVEEWKAVLDPEVFRIARLHGTERPHSSEYCARFEPGRYACACCHTLLFDADQKFESGTGWPSFTQPADPDVIRYVRDTSFGMIRVETLCAVCDAHLGHVFPDGPPPSGLRYCMNGLALEKQEEGL